MYVNRNKGYLLPEDLLPALTDAIHSNDYEGIAFLASRPGQEGFKRLAIQQAAEKGDLRSLKILLEHTQGDLRLVLLAASQTGQHKAAAMILNKMNVENIAEALANL